jgi:hypothetical protein
MPHPAPEIGVGAGRMGEAERKRAGQVERREHKKRKTSARSAKKYQRNIIDIIALFVFLLRYLCSLAS